MRPGTILIAFLFIANLLNGQTMRYFEIGLKNPAIDWDWRDTSFVLAASDSALLAEIQAELARPVAERRHVSGPLEGGHGGFNHNSDYWFSWHIGANQWQFAEISAEVCDGRPYSDVEADTAYWIQTVGYYCPWSGYVKREISAPVSVPEPSDPIAVFLPAVPNPANEEVLLSWELKRNAHVTLSITDALGRLTITVPLGEQQKGIWTNSVAVAALSDGVYFAMLHAGKQQIVQQFIIQN